MNREDHLNLARVVIAALVHDIGKLAQRAGAEKSEGMDYKYEHCFYTEYFVDHYLPIPPELAPERSDIAKVAAIHHNPNPDSLEELAIQKADHLSAGMDRRELPEGQETTPHYLMARLESVFAQIRLEGRSKEDSSWVWPLRQLDAQPEMFPVALETQPTRDESRSEYKGLYEELKEEMNRWEEELVRKLGGERGIRFYIKGLITLLERFTWCVPSATYHTVPDISLFDHLLTTAALAQALWVYHTDCGGMPGQDPQEKKFLLLKGDLSGIQDYILRIKRSGGRRVAKLFRARSFYLQLVARASWVWILDNLGLFDVAKVMDAGGHFTLILPKTQEVEQKLLEIAGELEEWFYREFLGEVSLNLAWVAMSEADFGKERFPQKYKELSREVEGAKVRRFSRVLGRRGASMLLLKDAQFAEGACELCDVRPGKETKSYEDEQPLVLCRHCNGLVEMGKKLPEGKFVVIARAEGEKGVPLPGGMKGWVINEKERFPERPLDVATLKSRGFHAHMPIAGHIPEVRQEDIERWRGMGLVEEKENKRVVEGEEVKESEVKTFGLMAIEAREPDGEGSYKGKALLGVLKADVDNLGAVFTLGLKEHFSISRVAMLSRMMNHFFSEVLREMVEREFKDIYVVYAGGDDVFVIGPWSAPKNGGRRRGIVEFAMELEECFRHYTSHNPELSLSAGIAVVKPGLPVQAMAAQAEEGLEKAKTTETKASVSLFGVTAQWERMQELLTWGRRFRNLVEEEKLSTAQLMRLLDYSIRCRRGHDKGHLRDFLWRAHLAYDLARNVDKNEKWKDEEEKNELKRWLQDETNMRDLRAAVTYALYQLRRE